MATKGIATHYALTPGKTLALTYCHKLVPLERVVENDPTCHVCRKQDQVP